MSKLALMKIIFFAAAILLSCFFATAQTLSIPDRYFEQALIGLDIDSDGMINGQVLVSDVTNVTELLLDNENGSQITSLTGLEAFVNLETFQIIYSQITTLDVSHNLMLKKLDCRSNSLTNINVSENVLLEQLYVGNDWDVGPFNEITQLDLSHNPNLKLVEASNLAAGMDWINLKNSNNNPDMEIRLGYSMPVPDNTNIVCITVDDENLALNDQLPYSEWNIRTGYNAFYRYSEECTLSKQVHSVNNNTYVYPNPASNILHIGSRLANAAANVMLYDISGRLVMQRDVKNDDSIDISGLVKGVYMVVIDDGTKRSSHKVIVE
jgi:hypothetical protein